MIRLSCENGSGAVELLEQNHVRHLVGEGQWFLDRKAENPPRQDGFEEYSMKKEILWRLDPRNATNEVMEEFQAGRGWYFDTPDGQNVMKRLVAKVSSET